MTAAATAPIVAVDARLPLVAVADIYYKACVLGNLKLSSAEVELLDKDPNADVRGMGVSLPIEKATYFRVKRLNQTYLSMVTYRRSKRARLASICTVSSGLVDLASGYRVFRTFSKVQPRREVPFITNTWFIEEPKLGYRQVYSNWSGQWASFTTEIFVNSSKRVEEQKETK